jgi:MoaA/NifB/PqqE/SkfB family radical SAM enzyme
MHIFGELNGTFHLCCHAAFQDNPTIVGSHEESLVDIWNSDTYKKTRLNFLKNKIPADCITACYNKEKQGSDSNRLQVNKRFSKHAHLQAKTNLDGSLNNKPTYLDIRFGNLCNFKCRMCSPHSSTSWYTDTLETGFSKVIDHFTKNKVFWEDVPDFIPHLEEVYFAGGEPFVQDGHYKLLELIIDSGHAKNINLSYNTNLSYSKYKKHNIQELWDNFKSISLWPSMDGFGKRAEYSRKGLSWEKFHTNAMLYKKYITTISSVINIFSITSMPDLILWCKHNNFDFYGTTLIYPLEQKITCLPKSTKKEILAMYKCFLYTHKDILNTYDIEQIKNWLTFMMSRDDSHLLPAFRLEQTRLDNLRNESFTEIFTEYSSWY